MSICHVNVHVVVSDKFRIVLCFEIRRKENESIGLVDNSEATHMAILPTQAMSFAWRASQVSN